MAAKILVSVPGENDRSRVRPSLGSAAAFFLSVGLAGLLAACGPRASSNASSASEWFEDVTGRLGVNFVHDPSAADQYFMPRLMGSGGALFDFDNDGRVDVYLLQSAPPSSGKTNHLFHQEANGTFRDVTIGSGLDVAGYGMGAAIG